MVRIPFGSDGVQETKPFLERAFEQDVLLITFA